MGEKILFLDYDNTIYSHFTQRIPQSALDALDECIRRGHRIIIATGRGPESASIIRSSLRLPCEDIICLNGQLVLQGERITYEEHLCLSSLEAVIKTCQASGFAYGGYCQMGQAVNAYNERVHAVWRDFVHPLPVIIPEIARQMPIYQGHLYITEEEGLDIDDLLADYITNRSHEYLLNVISRQSGKSARIREMIEQSGVSFEDSYAIGDGFNDVDMLSCVAHGVAMGNATQELKRVAEFTTAHIDDDGLYLALQALDLVGN